MPKRRIASGPATKLFTMRSSECEISRMKKLARYTKESMAALIRRLVEREIAEIGEAAIRLRRLLK